MHFLILLFIFDTGVSRAENHVLRFRQIPEYVEKLSLEIQAQKQDEKIALAEESIASRWANPALYLDTQLMRFNGSWDGSQSGGPEQQDLMLSFPLDVSGKRGKRSSSLEWLTKAVQAFSDAKYRSEVYEAESAFLNQLKSKTLISLLEERSRSLKLHLEGVQEKTGSGVLLQVLKARILVAYEQLNYQIAQKRIEESEAKKSLLLNLGFSLNDKIDIPETLDELLTSIDDVPTESETLYDDSPLLRSYDLRLKANQAERSFVSSSVWDDFSLMAGLQKQNSFSSSLTNPVGVPGALSWTAGLTFPIPLLDRKQGEFSKNQANFEKLSIGRKIERRNLERDFDKVLVGFSEYSRLVSHLKKSVLPSATQMNSKVSRAFASGGVTLFEFLDSSQSYYDIEMSLEEAELETLLYWRKWKALKGIQKK